MLLALLCPPASYDRPYFGSAGTPFWVEDFLLLALAWTGVLIWRRRRPPTHLLFISMVLPAIATALTFGQIKARELDQLGAAIVLWSCLLATLLVYLLIMREELQRVVKVMLPRARVMRR